MNIWNLVSCTAVVWMLHGCLSETCSPPHESVSTMVIGSNVEVNSTAHDIYKRYAFPESSTYMAYGDDLCSESSNLSCKRLHFLSLTRCLSNISDGLLGKTISSFHSNATSAEMLGLQTRGANSPSQLEIPLPSGNNLSYQTSSLVLGVSDANRYVVDRIHNLVTAIEFYFYLAWWCMVCCTTVGYGDTTSHKTGDIIATIVFSGPLLFATAAALICLWYKRQQLRWITDERLGGLEAPAPELIIVYANGDPLFDDQTAFVTATEVSYNAIRKDCSWKEILEKFKTSLHRTCITLITANYLLGVTAFLANDSDEETRDQVTSFHLSQRTVPVLIGHLNVEEFPESLRAVYFKLNLQRMPQYPTNGTSLQNILRQINTKSHAFMNWSEDIDVQLHKSYNNVKTLISQLETVGTNTTLADMLSNHSISLTADVNVRIAESVQTVMENLYIEVRKHENILDGALVGIGSFWDGTRVGEAPSEFDYLYILSNVNKYITGCYKCGIGKYRLKCEKLHTLTGASSMLSNFAVRDLMCTCIEKSMKRLSLPEDLHHGGVLSPCFSGVRKNGPAITLLFVWTGDQYKSKPLLISVDVMIAIRPIHLPAFMQDDSTLAAVHRFQYEMRVLRESHLIADANLDNIWQRTTAKIEVSFVKHMRPTLLSTNLLSNTIKMLKILNNVVLTVQEPDGSSQVGRELKQQGNSPLDDVTTGTKASPKECYRLLSFKDDDYNSANVSILTGGPNQSPTSYGIREAIFSLITARNSHLAEVNLSGKCKLPPDEIAKAMSGLAGKLYQILEQDTVVMSEYRSFRFEEETTVSSKQGEVLDQTKLIYLSHALEPCECHLLFEDCKPLITLKSCVFKYVLMEFLQVGGVSPMGSEYDDPGFDLDLMVMILKKIQKSKQLRHPVLGYPILTYSVSPRVQDYAIQNRRLTQDTEDRLSEILYDNLAMLIEILDVK